MESENEKNLLMNVIKLRQTEKTIRMLKLEAVLITEVLTEKMECKPDTE